MPTKLFIPEQGGFIEAKFDPKDNVFINTDTGLTVTDNMISFVKNPPRKKWTKCIHCGAVIPDTDKAKEEHAKEAGTAAKCETCAYKCIVENGNSVSKIRTIDGKKFRIDTTEIREMCSFRGNDYDIGSDEAYDRCKFRDCRNAIFAPVENFHIAHPGVFDVVATVSALDAENWYMYGRYNFDCLLYRANGKYPIYCEVGSSGLITGFYIIANQSKQNFAYDTDHDKIWWVNEDIYPRFYEDNYSVSNGAKSKIHTLMKKIYKEEENND